MCTGEAVDSHHSLSQSRASLSETRQSSSGVQDEDHGRVGETGGAENKTQGLNILASMHACIVVERHLLIQLVL